jgi:drug/metabolite transporter (DMT)-like permease
MAGFLRFAIGGLLLAGYLMARREIPKRPFDWSLARLIVIMGTLGIFVYATFEFVGVDLSTAVQGSIIDGFCPTSIALFAILMHEERFSNRWKYLGFPVSFLGVVFVVGVQALVDFRLEYLIGDLVLLMGAFLWGYYSALVKRGLRRTTPFRLTTGAVIVGTTLFGLASLFEGSLTSIVALDPVIWLCALYLGAGSTFIGFVLYYTGVKNLGMNRAGIFLNLVPVFGTLFSVLILSEAVPLTFTIGLVLVVIGVAIINMPERTSSRAEQPAETLDHVFQRHLFHRPR